MSTFIDLQNFFRAGDLEAYRFAVPNLQTVYTQTTSHHRQRQQVCIIMTIIMIIIMHATSVSSFAEAKNSKWNGKEAAS